MKSTHVLLIGFVILGVLGASFLYLTFIKPHQIKADCYKAAYSVNPRKNENNFEWAEGKKWMPKPGEPVTTTKYVWIYPDQSNTTQEGVDAATARSNAREYRYSSCIHSQGY